MARRKLKEQNGLETFQALFGPRLTLTLRVSDENAGMKTPPNKSPQSKTAPKKTPPQFFSL